MNTRLVIFDLDGTLLDTIDDLASAVDHVLAVESLPRHTREEYRMMVGGGIRKLIFRALPETMRSDAFIDKCLSRFVDYYSDNIDRLTHPYPGIGRVMSQLESHGIAMAVGRIAESLVKDEHAVLPVSVVLEGEYGLEGLALSIPSIVGREGLEEVLEIPLSGEEDQALRQSAKQMEEAIASLHL